MIIGSCRILTSAYLTYLRYLCVSIFVLHSGFYMRTCTVSTTSQESLLKHEVQIICETQCLHNLKTFPLKIKYKYTRYQMHQAININIWLPSSSQHTRLVTLSLEPGPNWLGIILSSITLGTKVHRRQDLPSLAKRWNGVDQTMFSLLFHW